MAAFIQFVAEEIAEADFRSIVVRQGTIQLVIFVDRAIQLAIGVHTPIHAKTAIGEAVKRGGAIRAESVVPAGLLVQAIDRINAIEEAGSEFLCARLESVQTTNLISAVSRPPEDDLMPVRDENDQLLLPIADVENRIVLSLPIPYFD